MVSAPNDALYHQTKTPIGFWCRWGLNSKSLIQPSKTLPIELTGTHNFTCYYSNIYFKIDFKFYSLFKHPY